MATDDHVNALQQVLNSLLEYTDTELTNRTDWGAINFESARPDVETALSIAKDLRGMPLKELSSGTAQQIQGNIPAVAELFKRIDEFSLLPGGDPNAIRDEICVDLHHAVEPLLDNASPFIPYLMYKSGDIAQNIENLNDAVTESKIQLNDAETWVNQKKSEIEKIAQAAREAAADAGVATFTEEFKSEADDLDKRSGNWLGAAVTLGIVTILAALWFYFWPEVPAEARGWEMLRNIASKVAVIAVLFTGTVWCGRIYRALRHQATVNRHRALSLKTFQAFIRATEDPYVRDAVLMAATRTVFGERPDRFCAGWWHSRLWSQLRGIWQISGGESR